MSFREIKEILALQEKFKRRPQDITPSEMERLSGYWRMSGWIMYRISKAVFIATLALFIVYFVARNIFLFL